MFGFAYDYIKKEDYSIRRTAAEMLYNKIDAIAEECSSEQRLTATMEIARQVLGKAAVRAERALLTMATRGKIQMGDYLVVMPEDVME